MCERCYQMGLGLGKQGVPMYELHKEQPSSLNNKEFMRGYFDGWASGIADGTLYCDAHPLFER